MFVHWSPFDSQLALLEEFRRRVDSVFEDFGEAQTATGWPRANLYDTGKAYVLKLPVPGVTESDLHIQATHEALTLTGERKPDVPQGYNVHRQERRPHRFSRGFTFPVPVNPDQVSAELKHGVLTITVQKAPEAQPRSITVTAG